jgi:N utilization substance protein B
VSARTKARKRAIDMLFAAEARGGGTAGGVIAIVLAEEAARAAHDPQRSVSWAYARDIVTGVQDHLGEIDETITSIAVDWPIERMPQVDRAILRMGVWEIRFNPEVPDAVAIAEAIELATTLSTERSASFVNGVLAKVADTAS